MTGVALLALAFDVAVEPLSDFTGSPPLVLLRMPDALVYGFFLSVPIEALVLLLLDRSRKLRSLVSSLGANVGSYVLLIAVYVFGRSFF